MLTIEVAQEGSVPRFRLFGEGEPPRIVTLVVQDAETEELVWVVAPPGTTVSVHEGFAAEHRNASEAEMADFQMRMQTYFEPMAAGCFEVLYGTVPPGFEQARPEIGSAPLLVRGRRYLAIAVAPSGMGVEEFEAS